MPATEQGLPPWSTPGPVQARQEQQAVAVATNAVAAAARPQAGISVQQWQQRVRRAVAPSAWEQLDDVDPARVTFTAVQGQARVLEQDDEDPAAEDGQDVVLVVVPTDDGGWWQVTVAEGAVVSMTPMETVTGP